MASTGRTKRRSRSPGERTRSAVKPPAGSDERVSFHGPSPGRRHEASVVVADQPELGAANDDSEPPTVPMGRDFTEANSSVEPEDLGRRFLRDATDPEGSLPVGDESQELSDEPPAGDVDLLADSIHEGSLFDQPTERGTRVPHVRADESASVEDDARAQAHRNTRAVLSHGRSRAERRPHR